MAKSFERIQNRRIVLTRINEKWGGGWDLNDVQECVVYFGDGQFVLRPMTLQVGQLRSDCTAIHMGGGKEFFAVMEDIETITEFLFGEVDYDDQ